MLQNRRIALLLALLSTLFVQAQTVWNGPTIVFTKASGADPTKAENQDRITPTTWITGGVFRAFTMLPPKPLIPAPARKTRSGLPELWQIMPR